MPNNYETLNGVSSEAVQARTGKTWAGWVKALDAEGCRKMNHKEIVAVVSGKFGIGAWWQQMVTVAYEQARGLREKHERPEGYSVSASKTIAARASALFKAWNDSKIRYKWLADPITIRKATPGKSLRLTWSDGKSSISVNLYAKGEGKSQVTVQHEKIANAKEAAKLKKFWGEKVEKLKELVEK